MLEGKLHRRIPRNGWQLEKVTYENHLNPTKWQYRDSGRLEKSVEIGEESPREHRNLINNQNRSFRETFCEILS